MNGQLTPENGGSENWVFHNRDLRSYLSRLFPDIPGSSFIEEHVGEEMVPTPLYYFFDASKQEYPSNPATRNFGGLELFFQPGSTILDIGSGGGLAVKEISDTYGGVACYGLDQRYFREPPPYVLTRGSYIAASWDDTRLPDNFFNRLLSYEAYPRYLWGDSDKDRKTFREITRISVPGTIWRGNFQRTVTEDYFSELVMTELGWDVYVSNRQRAFIAILKNKP